MFWLVVLGVIVVFGFIGWLGNKGEKIVTSNIVCPHCHTRGRVTRKQTVTKHVSGGKVAGAALTGGVSLLATGVNKKQKSWLATCHNCGWQWR